MIAIALLETALPQPQTRVLISPSDLQGKMRSDILMATPALRAYLSRISRGYLMMTRRIFRDFSIVHFANTAVAGALLH